MFKNSYTLYIFNKFRYSACNFILGIFSSEIKNNFKNRQKECIWCKRTHTKEGYFCSKSCSKIYNRDKYQIFKINNRCQKHKFQKYTYRGQCWSCYQKNYIESVKSHKLEKSFRLRLMGFKIIPTFRTSLNSWNGDKVAFEQYLRDKKIKWFVYIKFYENKRGKILPLVAGLSASTKINSGGSDLNFSLNIKDGPARQFLQLNKNDWYYYKIAIKKCKSPQEAYKLESELLDKFNLFGS